MFNILPSAYTRNNDLLEAYAFVDTLILLWYRAPAKGLLYRLSRQYGRRLKFRPLLKRRRDRPCPWVMKIQQPTRETLQALNAIQRQP
jgi:hypothetical protein